MSTEVALQKLTARLDELEAERVTLETTRTREDVRELAESWLATACRRMNGTAGFVLNQHVAPEQIQAVIAEFLLDSPALLDFIVKKVEATTTLTNRQRDSRLRKNSTEKAELEKQKLALRKELAMEQLEREFAEVT
jgi:hypothetical protein